MSGYHGMRSYIKEFLVRSNCINICVFVRAFEYVRTYLEQWFGLCSFRVWFGLCRMTMTTTFESATLNTQFCSVLPKT